VLALGATLALAALACLLVFATPAGAVVTPMGAPQFGVEPHSVTPLPGEPKLPLTYHDGPVMHSNATYAIYWDPEPNPAQPISWRYDGDWRALIDEYFQAVGHDSATLGNVYAVAGQYSDSSGARAAYRSTFRGAYTDTNPYPTTGACTDPAPEPTEKFACLTDTQLREQLTSFITSHGLQTGPSTMFFLLTPPGVTVCTDGGTASGHCSDSKPSSPASYEHSFCSYHSYIPPESNPIIYAVQPWTAGNLGMFLPFSEESGTVSGSDCQDGTGLQQEPNQVLSPPGLDTDGDYDRGLADVIINEISVEQIATETNPLLNGWYAPVGQANAGNEVTDQCRNFFAAVPMGGKSTPPEKSLTGAGTLSNQSLDGHSYYINDEFDQAALTMDYPGVACLPDVHLEPHFTTPNPVNAGDIVGFDASESNITLAAGPGFPSNDVRFKTYPTYAWSFGDGSQTVSSFPPGASRVDEPSVFHSYQYGGTYEVTLTVTDVGGNVASFTSDITVKGPPRPSNSTATAAAPGATSGAGSTYSPGASVKPLVLGPVASMAVGSHSLSRALRGGLVVRYSVSQQVTGHFEVLLAASIARRIGLHGPLATGLAQGTPPQLVIAKALIITTRAGRGTLQIQFGKITARRLRRLHAVPLTLRLSLRNAGGGTTTVLSALTLQH
jgi:hypothetical protein